MNSFSFLNIPYATPPLKELRFVKPKPPVNIKGTFDATQFGNGCFQRPGSENQGVGLMVSEDCLNLNVFVPKTNKTKLPVVVYILGGGFNSGYAADPMYDARNVLEISDSQIIVTFNYRVAAFGFLASSELANDSMVNIGLYDQVEVFKWVQKYISEFGGDPDNVTAFGQSAGAIAIGSLLTAQDGLLNLFHRAILHSGGPSLVLKTPNMEQGNYNKVLNATGCYDYKCLQNVPAEILLEASYFISYMPVIDNDLFNQPPIKNLLTGKFMKIPIMMNAVADEGTLFTRSIQNDSQVIPFKHMLFPYFTFTQFDQLQILYPDYPSATKLAGDIYGDAGFQCPQILLANFYQMANLNVYKSKFNVKTGSPLGVSHGSDLPFTWAAQSKIDPSNKAISDQIVSYWTRFVAGQEPSEDWKRIDQGRLLIGSTTYMESDSDRTEKCKFFLDVLISMASRM
jgi:triacylglycerol lipase